MKMRLQQAFSTLVNLAGGANIEAGGKSAYNNASWGGTTKKIVKISFCPTPFYLLILHIDITLKSLMNIG